MSWLWSTTSDAEIRRSRVEPLEPEPWQQLQPAVPLLHRITIEETCPSRGHYFGR